MIEALRLAEHVIELADGDRAMGAAFAGSPLAGATRDARLLPNMPGHKRMAVRCRHGNRDGCTALPDQPRSRRSLYKYVVAIPVGALPADSTALRETADALRIAERVGNEYTLALARLDPRRRPGPPRRPHKDEGFDLLIQARATARKKGFTLNALAVVDPELAKESARNGDLDRAIELSRWSARRHVRQRRDVLAGRRRDDSR